MKNGLQIFGLAIFSLVFFALLPAIAKTTATKPVITEGRLIKMVIGRDNSGGDVEGTSSPVKVAANRKLCWDSRMKTTVDCGVGDCPDNPQVEYRDSNNARVVCTLDCDGQMPDSSGVCDCPIAIDEETMGLDCETVGY